MRDIVYIRVPRTGSSSTTTLLKLNYGKDRIFFAAHESELEMYKSTDLWYTDNKKAIEHIRHTLKIKNAENYSVITGHVPARAIHPMFNNRAWFITLRDPIMFVISGYFFSRHLGHIPEFMTVYEYAELPYRRNWQSVYFGDIHWYDYILIYERLHNHVAFLANELGWQYRRLPESNGNKHFTPDYMEQALRLKNDSKLIELIKECHKDDCELYRFVNQVEENYEHGQHCRNPFRSRV